MTNALPPAHWAADPSGRHEYRYWDGTHWTDHVADQGRPSIDPIMGSAPSTTTAEPAAADAPTEPRAGERSPAHADSPAAAAAEPDTTPERDAPTAPIAPAADPERITWPPAPADDADLPSPDEPGWAAPTPAAPAASPPAAPGPSLLAPPPPPPIAGTGYVTGARAAPYGATAWRSMSGLKTALVVLFVCLALSAIGLFVTAAARIAAVGDYRDSPSFTTARALRDADDAMDAAAGIYAILRIAIIVVFIIWLWRAAKNALELLRREGPTFTPGWAIGGWFIPLANFVIPVMLIQGLWRATAPGTRPGVDWKAARGSALVTVWWVMFLASIASAYAVGDDASLDDIENADTIVAFGAAASVVAAVLAIFVVVHLTRRFHDRRAEELGV